MGIAALHPSYALTRYDRAAAPTDGKTSRLLAFSSPPRLRTALSFPHSNDARWKPTAGALRRGEI
jgi:hypothetical protein